MIDALSLENVVLPQEKTYYRIALTFSILVWIAVAATLVGPLYALGAAFALWLTNGLLIARLRSESVEVTETQFPELHATHQEVCRSLGQASTPPLYILQSGGVLNAFATRHGGRDFVVIHSSFLEALGESGPAIRFLIGHEIGHVRRKHLFKRLFILPGYVVPLLGHAYSRACEATCDRHGLLAAGETAGATRALLVLAAGKEGAPKGNASEFAEQHYRHRGFFVSWHELNSGYPTLSRRVSNLLALEDPRFARPAERHPLAYFFSFFVSPQMGIAAYVIFILVILAIPAFKRAKAQSEKIRKQHLEQSQGNAQPPAPAGDPAPIILPSLPTPPPSAPSEPASSTSATPPSGN